MKSPAAPVLALVAVLAAGGLAAQEAPKPAPELQKLQPLVGHWRGSGKVHEPGKTSKWQAAGTYQWALDGFWLQGDFSIQFEGIESPMYRRTYFGWDAEHKRMVGFGIDNGGLVVMQDLAIQADGSMVQLRLAQQDGVDYAERSVFKVDGDKLNQTVDLLLPAGASLQIVDGGFQRTEQAPQLELPSGSFLGAPAAEPMPKFAAWVGSYEVAGTVVPMPGMPELKMRSTDQYRMLFGGSILHCRSDGEVEGLPGKHAAEAFLGHDPKHGGLVTMFVSSFGECGMQSARFAADGKQLISTMAMLFQGEPMLQRAVFELDAAGRPTGLAAHCLLGSHAPYVSVRATLTRK